MFSERGGCEGLRSLSTDNILEPESGYSSASQHQPDTSASNQVKRSRLKKSVSSDGMISSGGLADISDSSLPSLAPVVVTKSGGGQRGSYQEIITNNVPVGQSPTYCNGANGDDFINFNKTEPGAGESFSNDFLDDNAMDETKRKISVGETETSFTPKIQLSGII